MWKSAEALPLSAAQRADLDALVRSGKTPQRVVTRARIVLAAADGTAVESQRERRAGVLGGSIRATDLVD